MSSANKTANYGLNQWAGNEYPKRQDFVDDNAVIDAQMKANADGAASAAEHIARTDNPHKVTAAQVGASNPNLLINGDFRVNQRSVESVNGNGSYFVDRWYYYYSGTNVNGARCTLSRGHSGDKFFVQCALDSVSIEGVTFHNFVQILEDDSAGISSLSGKTVTFSCYVHDTTCNKCMAVIWYDSSNHYHSVIKPIGPQTEEFIGIVTFTVTFLEEVHRVAFSIMDINPLTSDLIGKYTAIWDVKVELGSVATPFSPRPYAKELALCRRYYQNNWHCVVANYQTTDIGTLHIPLCQPMRILPSLVLRSSLDGFVETQWGENVTPTNLRIAEGDTNGVILEFDNGKTGAVFGVKSDAIGFDSEIY